MVNGAESTKQIIEYIEKNMKKGYKIEDLRWALINQKQSRGEIEKAIKIIEARNPSIKKEEKKEEVKIIATENFEIPMIEKKPSFFKKIFRKSN